MPSAAGETGCPPLTDAHGNRPLLLLGCWFVGCTLFLHGFAFEARHLYLAGLSGDGDPGGDRLGEEDRWRALRRRQALDGPDRLVHLPDWPVGPAGHFCRHADRAADTVLRCRIWTLAVVAALTSLAPLGSWLRGRDRWTLGLAATTVCGQLVVLLVVRLSPGGRCALRPRFGRLFQSHAGTAVEVVAGPGRRSARSFSISIATCAASCSLARWYARTSTTLCPRPRWTPTKWIVVPERHVHVALNDFDLSALPYERAGRFRIYRRSDVEPRAMVGQVDVPLLR